MSLSLAERQAAAQPYHDEARALVQRGIKEGELMNLPTSYAMHGFAFNYLQRGEFDDAELLFRVCLPIREKEEPDAWTTFNTRNAAGSLLAGQRKVLEMGARGRLLAPGLRRTQASRSRNPPRRESLT